MSRSHGLARIGVILVAALATLPSAAAVDSGGPDLRAESRAAVSGDREAYATGWSFYTDNDFFSFGLSADRGYTGGFALTLHG